MKKTIWVMAIYASVALVAAPAFVTIFELTAQAQTAAQGQCTDETKAGWYADFIKFRTTDPPKAYDPAKKYLAACPTEEGQIPDYLKKWVVAYDKEARKLQLQNLFIHQRKYAEAMPVAREVLKDDPENLMAHIALGYGGYVQAVTTKNETGNGETISYTKQSIQMIESGKTMEVMESGKLVESWSPFKAKEDALGYLYYSLGYLERTSNTANSLSNAIKAAEFDGDMKKSPQTYVFIAAAYENEYAKQSAEYERLYKNKDETPESKLAVANISQIVDRVIDALARAVAVAGTDAASQQSKTQWLTRLTELYKFRHDSSDAGLTEMIASVMSHPLPPPPKPLTTLPAAPPTTSTSPASGSSSAAGSTAAPGTATPQASVKTPATAPAAKTTTAKAATTPAQAASTKPAAKPKTRNNHRRP